MRKKVQRVVGWVALSYPVWVALYWASWANRWMVGVRVDQYDGFIATMAVYGLLAALWASLLALILYVLLRVVDLLQWLYARRGERS